MLPTLKRRLEKFCPAKPSKPIIKASEPFTPVVLRRVYSCHEVHCDPLQLRSFEALRGESVMLIPNHPSKADAAVLFELSQRTGQFLYQLSNREQFDKVWGVYGRYLQALGAYSIARGVSDRASFQFTRKLLCDGPNNVAIFPEGGTFSRADRIFAFQEGVFQLGFWALGEMMERSVDRGVTVQPVALRYTFLRDASDAIGEALDRLEISLSLNSRSAGDFEERIKRIAAAALGRAEESYGLTRNDDGDLHMRLYALKECALKSVATLLGISAGEPDISTLYERTRRIFNAFHKVDLAVLESQSAYDLNLLRHEADKMRVIRRELNRLENWIDVSPRYIEEHPSEERIADTIIRLEREVHHAVYFKAPTRCMVRFGTPIDLRDFYASDGSMTKKSKIADMVARQTEQAVQSELEWMQQAERASPFIQTRLRKTQASLNPACSS